MLATLLFFIILSMMNTNWENQIKAQIKSRYKRQAKGNKSNFRSPFEMGYPDEVLEKIPLALLEGYSGCGYYFRDINLNGNEQILDLGSGSGLDSYIISTHLVTGIVLSLDITFEMLSNLDIYNIKSVCGDMELLPFFDQQFDMIIANASFNLTTNKEKALSEAFRVLKRGGQIRMRDLIKVRELPQEVLIDPLSFNTSLGGAEDEESVRIKMKKAGFSAITISDHQPFSYLNSVRIAAKKSKY